LLLPSILPIKLLIILVRFIFFATQRALIFLPADALYFDRLENLTQTMRLINMSLRLSLRWLWRLTLLNVTPCSLVDKYYHFGKQIRPSFLEWVKHREELWNTANGQLKIKQLNRQRTSNK
jgi:hypothetical protein